jgi:hypothetical protein
MREGGPRPGRPLALLLGERLVADAGAVVCQRLSHL